MTQTTIDDFADYTDTELYTSLGMALADGSAWYEVLAMTCEATRRGGPMIAAQIHNGYKGGHSLTDMAEITGLAPAQLFSRWIAWSKQQVAKRLMEHQTQTETWQDMKAELEALP